VELTNETKARTANKLLPKAGLNGFDWTFVQGSIFVLRLNFCAKNPRLRQYPNRCGEIRSAPFATTVRRITSASCARRFADFAQQADLLNPKNGSKLPSRDFANPPNRWQKFYKEPS
jgi:hypothetical protein